MRQELSRCRSKAWRREALPHLPVQPLRHGLVLIGGAGARDAAALAAPVDYRAAHAADGIILYEACALSEELHTALLQSDLDYPVVFGDCVHGHFAVIQIVRQGLFTVDVFPCLASCGDQRSVPVIGCGNEYHVDIFPVQYAAEIAIARCLVSQPRHDLKPAVQVTFVRIAGRHKAQVGLQHRAG